MMIKKNLNKFLTNSIKINWVKLCIITLLLIIVVFIFKDCSARSHINRGHRFFDLGKFDSAIKFYSLALEYDPNNPNIYFFRGSTYLKKGEEDSAITDFSRAIEIDSTYVKAYINRGTIWKRKGKIDKAIADYNEVIRLSPKDHNAYNVRADLWFEQGKYDHSIHDYSASIKIKPNVIAYTGMADAEFKKGDYENSIIHYKKAIELDDKYVPAYNSLAWILAVCVEDKYRNGKEALTYAKKATELTPNGYTFDTLAAAYAETGDFDGAVKIIKKIIASDYKEVPKDTILSRLELYGSQKPLRE